MQVKCFSAVFRNRSVIKVLLAVLIIISVILLLIFLSLVLSLDIQSIAYDISVVLGTDASDLKFIGGGRRCDGMVAFEYLGDDKPFIKYKLELKRSDSDPDVSEYLDMRNSLNLESLKWVRSFVARHDIPISLEEAELFRCSSLEFPRTSEVFIVFSGGRIFLFHPT